jgi:hypothetical protein
MRFSEETAGLSTHSADQDYKFTRNSWGTSSPLRPGLSFRYTQPRRLVHFTICGWEFPRAAFPRPAVRRHRTPPDDCIHLCRVRYPAHRKRRSIRARHAQRDPSDVCLEHHLLLRLDFHWKFVRLRLRCSTRSGLESAASPDRGYSAH